MLNKKQTASSFFKELKQNAKCVVCGFGHPAVIEFHHIEPKDKIDTISNMVHNGLDITTIKEELKKCQPMCKNHHAIIHWDERKNKPQRYGTQMVIGYE